MRHTIDVTINGERLRIDVDPRDTLLEMLRDKVGTKSVKMGCERGDCGACTVLLDGRTVRSCLVLAVETDHADLTTVEGLTAPELAELQNKLVAMSAFQCGFCAPGIVLGTVELLAHDPDPSRLAVQEALSGNLCRCTGYDPIVDAVLATARERTR